MAGRYLRLDELTEPLQQLLLLRGGAQGKGAAGVQYFANNRIEGRICILRRDPMPDIEAHVPQREAMRRIREWERGGSEALDAEPPGMLWTSEKPD